MPNSRVTGFVPRGRAEGSYHFIGVQVVAASVFAALPAGQPAALDRRRVRRADRQTARRDPRVRLRRGVLGRRARSSDYWSTSWSFAQAEGTADAHARPARPHRSDGARIAIDPVGRCGDRERVRDRRVRRHRRRARAARCELSPHDSAARGTTGAVRTAPLAAMTAPDKRTSRRPRAARSHRSLPARPRPRRRRRQGRAADRRCVGPPVLPHHPSRRTVDRARAARRTDRVRLAAVRQRRRAAPADAAAGSRAARTLRSARHRRARGSRRRHAAGAPRRRQRRPSTRRSIVRRSRSSRCCSGAAPKLDPDGYLPYRIAFDVEKLHVGARLLRQALRRGLPRRGAVGRAAGGARRGVVVDCRRARRRAARAVSPRLSQPQSDAARRPPVHHRFPGRAHGPGHLRSRRRCCAIRTSTSSIARSTI